MSRQLSLQSLLGSAAAPVYDREAMLREVLAARISKWLDGKIFFVNEMQAMRVIARDIQGVSETYLEQPLPPEDIKVLHCLDFENLSEISLFESVVASLEYVGVTETTGSDLLGAEAWAELQRRVAALKDAPVAEASTVSSWAQLTLAKLAGDVFGGDFFNICELDKLASALDETRLASRLPSHASNKTTYAALRVIHCTRWREMDPDISAGLKDAVWQVCGLDEQLGPVAFGEYWERIKGLSPPVPGAQAEALSNVESESQETEVASPSQETDFMGQPGGAPSGWLARFAQNLLRR